MTDTELQVQNPFDNLPTKDASESSGLVEIEEQRAIAEVQSRMMHAIKIGRDERRAMDRILQACTRKTLADTALYAFPRGGSMVTGPSIRIAETIAQNWGHMDIGIRELTRKDGVSIAEAYAWDLVTNVRVSKSFHVPHMRTTKRGLQKLTDERDIYEMVANMGARRLRACILGVVPGDVVEQARRQCEITQEQSEGAPEETIKKLVTAFADYQVSDTMLMKRLGHNLQATTSAEIVMLKRIYASLRDGMAKPDQYFEADDTASALTDKLMKAKEKKESSNGN